MERITITGYPTTAPWASFIPGNGADVRIMEGVSEEGGSGVFVVVTTYGGDNEFDAANIVSIWSDEAAAVLAMERYADI